MGHFAKIENNIVVDVIVAEQEVIDSGLFGDPSKWIQTSYNTFRGTHPENRPLRKNYAGIGSVYDPIRDAFYRPQPFPSWTLNEDTCVWEAPISRPNDGKRYDWDEDNQTWIEFIL